MRHDPQAAGRDGSSAHRHIRAKTDRLCLHPSSPRNLDILLRRPRIVPRRRNLPDPSAHLTTPHMVQRWLCELPYNWERHGDTARGITGVLEHGQAHCLEAALTAAAILEQHGYPPLLLDIESADHLDHVLFLYERDGKWGTVARSRCAGLHGRRPIFASLPDLVRSYQAPFVDATGRVTGYGVLDLRKLPTRRWATAPGNHRHVEEALRGMPHNALPMPEASYRYWRQRYDAWWQANGKPDHDWPLHYDQSSWNPRFTTTGPVWE